MKTQESIEMDQQNNMNQQKQSQKQHDNQKNFVQIDKGNDNPSFRMPIIQKTFIAPVTKTQTVQNPLKGIQNKEGTLAADDCSPSKSMNMDLFDEIGLQNFETKQNENKKDFNLKLNSMQGGRKNSVAFGDQNWMNQDNQNIYQQTEDELLEVMANIGREVQNTQRNKKQEKIEKNIFNDKRANMNFQDNNQDDQQLNSDEYQNSNDDFEQTDEINQNQQFEQIKDSKEDNQIQLNKKKKIKIEESDDDIDSNDSVKQIYQSVKKHEEYNKLRNQLQDILGEMIKDDVSTIEMLRNNAKTIGGIVGAEYQFFENNKSQSQQKEEEQYFYDKQLMQVQDITFKQIEKTTLGRQIKNQLTRLEDRCRGMSNTINDLKANSKQREQAILAQAEEELQQKFAEKHQRSNMVFKEEMSNLKNQFRIQKKDQTLLYRSLKKIEKIALAAESQISRLKISMRLGDLEQIYDSLKIDIPNKLKVALFLIDQFSRSDFDFKVIEREEQLQIEYEQLNNAEISQTGELGQKHFKSNEDAKKKKIRHSVTVGEKKADKKGGKNAKQQQNQAQQQQQNTLTPEMFVIQMMQRKSYLGDSCVLGIKDLFMKISNVEREVTYYEKEKITELEDKCRGQEGFIYQLQAQADQMESELENLFKINSMYQETIQGLEGVIKIKDRIIHDHLQTISKLTEGRAQELKDIKLMFFSKQKELVDQIKQWRDKYNESNNEFKSEILIRDKLENRLNGEVIQLKEELLLAKRILRDPQLSQLASRKFNETINREDDNKFFIKGAVMTDLLNQQDNELANFEVELPIQKHKLVPGTTVKFNCDVPAGALNLKNQFDKVQFSQFTPNTIKFRKKAQAGGSIDTARNVLQISNQIEFLKNQQEINQKKTPNIESMLSEKQKFQSSLTSTKELKQIENNIPSTIIQWFNDKRQGTKRKRDDIPQTSSPSRNHNKNNFSEYFEKGEVKIEENNAGFRRSELGVNYLHNLVKSLKNDRDQINFRRRLLNTVNEDERPGKHRRNIQEFQNSVKKGFKQSNILSFESNNLQNLSMVKPSTAAHNTQRIQNLNKQNKFILKNDDFEGNRMNMSLQTAKNPKSKTNSTRVQTEYQKKFKSNDEGQIQDSLQSSQKQPIFNFIQNTYNIQTSVKRENNKNKSQQPYIEQISAAQDKIYNTVYENHSKINQILKGDSLFESMIDSGQNVPINNIFKNQRNTVLVTQEQKDLSQGLDYYFSQSNRQPISDEITNIQISSQKDEQIQAIKKSSRRNGSKQSIQIQNKEEIKTQITDLNIQGNQGVDKIDRWAEDTDLTKSIGIAGISSMKVRSQDKTPDQSPSARQAQNIALNNQV